MRSLGAVILVDMDKISSIAEKYKLTVIEDAAHALGSVFRGKKIGTISDYTAFSFQAIKHMTTGDGGLLVVKDNDDFNTKCSPKRWFAVLTGKNRRDNPDSDSIVDISHVGFKYHMNDTAATIGIDQLNYFDENLAIRKDIVDLYTNGLKDVSEVRLLNYEDNRVSSFGCLHSMLRKEPN